MATSPAPISITLVDRIQELFQSGFTIEAVSRIVQREASWRDLVAVIHTLLSAPSGICPQPAQSIVVPAPSGICPQPAQSIVVPAPSGICPQPAQQSARLSAQTPTFLVTAQHHAIFRAMADRSGKGGTIPAVAGSGKTTTLVEGTRRMFAADSRTSMAFFAFNRTIAQTLRRRLPARVTCSTLHSVCWQAIVRSRGWQAAADDRVQNGRVRDAAHRIVRQNGVPRPGTVARELRVLWSLATATLTDLASPEQLVVMAEFFGVAIEEDSPALHLVEDLDRALKADREHVSYDEMLSIVVAERLTLPVSAELVLVDEAQDLNRLQIEVLKLINPKRVIAVGDRHQAIYSFRGADHRAMETMADQFGLDLRLPLSVTYRCARSIVDEAKRLVPEIEARPGAPIGDVIERGRDQLATTIAGSQAGDLVLCRTNAPLLKALLRRRKQDAASVCLIGKDIGSDLVNLIESTSRMLGTASASMVAERLSEEATQRAVSLEESGSVTAAETVRDEAAMASTLLRECDTTDEAARLVERIFKNSPDPAAINFSTIHKSKGLEADHVIILGHNLIPSQRVLNARNNEVMIAEERNILYVAFTRARLVLIKQEMTEEDLQ